MSLTGAYSQDIAAVFGAFEDYVKYINETKNLAPWREDKWPADITLELMWRDDELKPSKAMTIYEELKAKGMMVFYVSGSPQALAMKNKLYADSMGAVTLASGPYLLKPPQTIFTIYPLYTDALAGIADWFKENWKEKRKPRVAYLTADNAMGRSIEIPEMKAYLEKIGYEFVGTQYMPLVPSSPPTTQLMWLRERGADLALGAMILPGSQTALKEMVRLGMGPYQEHKMIYGTVNTTQVADVVDDMGELGDGFVAAASVPPWDELDIPGVRFSLELQKKYRPKDRIARITYEAGLFQAMIQVEALWLAAQKVPFEKLTRSDVLNHGFYKIKNLDTGDLSCTPLTYGPSDVEGVDGVRLYQIRKGKAVNLGVWPCHHIYAK
jgi:branched-chain amino acid transport system substrate-binding protein